MLEPMVCRDGLGWMKYAARRLETTEPMGDLENLGSQRRWEALNAALPWEGRGIYNMWRRRFSVGGKCRIKPVCHETDVTCRISPTAPLAGVGRNASRDVVGRPVRSEASEDYHRSIGAEGGSGRDQMSPAFPRLRSVV